jgi:predicted RNase H-like HicB family nuclease
MTKRKFRATIPADEREWFLRLLRKHRCGKPVGVQSLPRGKGAWSYSFFAPPSSMLIIAGELFIHGVRPFNPGDVRCGFGLIVKAAPGGGYVATYPEVPGANGQGATRAEAIENVFEAIGLLLLDRARGKAMNRSRPPDRASGKKSPEKVTSELNALADRMNTPAAAAGVKALFAATPRQLGKVAVKVAESAARATQYRGSFAKRRKRVFLPEFIKLMSKKTVGDTQADLDAVRGDR